MNLFQKITKTEWLMLALSLVFLLSLALLYPQADSESRTDHYTITVTHKTAEPVTPAPPPPVDINTATSEELQTLPGIGPAIAERIIAYREEHGSFASVEDLLNVKGIGEAVLSELQGLIIAGGTQNHINNGEDHTQ